MSIHNIDGRSSIDTGSLHASNLLHSSIGPQNNFIKQSIIDNDYESMLGGAQNETKIVHQGRSV